MPRQVGENHQLRRGQGVSVAVGRDARQRLDLPRRGFGHGAYRFGGRSLAKHDHVQGIGRDFQRLVQTIGEAKGENARPNDHRDAQDRH
jgi:hypothetical protein